MNESVVAIIATGVVTALCNLVATAFFLGGLRQKVSDHASAISSLTRTDGEQWEKIGQHGERISYLEARRELPHGSQQ